MNLLAMITLAVLVPSAHTEETDVWIRVSSNHVEILASPEHAEAVRTSSPEGILVQCKTLKINYTAEGKSIECEGCTFYTATGKNGTAHSAVFDQVKGILTLTGDETKPVEWTTSNENSEQKIVSQSMQITILRSDVRTSRVLFRPTPDPVGDGLTRSEFEGRIRPTREPDSDGLTRSGFEELRRERDPHRDPLTPIDSLEDDIPLRDDQPTRNIDPE